MKEHSLFIELKLMGKYKKQKTVVRKFQETFSNILKDAIELANCNVSAGLLSSREIVTKNTLDAEDAENKTSMLSGVEVNINITLNELNLRSVNNY